MKQTTAVVAGQEGLHPAADRNRLWALALALALALVALAPEHERWGKTIHLDEFQTMVFADFAITPSRLPVMPPI